MYKNTINTRFSLIKGKKLDQNLNRNYAESLKKTGADRRVIVKLFKGWLTGKVTELIEIGVVLFFVLGVFVFPVVLFSFDLTAGLIVFLYMPFLYFWLGPWLKRAQEWAGDVKKKAARWIAEN